MENKIEVQIDTRPYLPDIFLKNNIYTSCDGLNYNNYISIDQSIFIFNLNSNYDLISQYNDPGYLLYGISCKQQ